MSFFFRTKQSKTFLALSLGACFFAGSLFYYSSKIKPEVTHPDEAVRTRMAVYFKLFFIDQDFVNPLWERREVRIAPPGSAYIAGLALWLGGQGDRIGAIGIDNWWNFEESFAWNLANIKLPSGKELYILKFTMAIFVSLSGLVVYWVCLKCFGVVAAFFSSMLFIFHPLMLGCATKATFDAPLIFFIILNILLMLFFYENFSQKRYRPCLFFSGMIGLNAAVAAVIKIQGAIAAVIFLTFCFCVIMTEAAKFFGGSGGQKQARTSCAKRMQVIIISAILFAVMAVTFFILPNPGLYARPIKGLKEMAELRVEQINRQVKEFSTKNYFHDDYSTAVLVSFPQKIKYASLRIFQGECKTGLSFWARFVLFAAGFFLIFFNEIKYFRKNLVFSHNFIVLLWVVVLFAAVTAVLFIDFATHFFTFIAPVSILMAYGLDQMLRIGRRFFTQRIPR